VGRGWAALGSVAFFVLTPGGVVGLVPWWLTGWRVRDPPPGGLPLQALGGVLLLGGLAVLVHAFGRFVAEGRGTPAPVAPTERLVVGGLYRYVRNPMYLGVLAAIVGQGLLLGQLGLLAYAALVWVAVATFVQAYEEPTLHARYGAEYDAYRRAVPAWWPRLRPWRPQGPDGGGTGATPLGTASHKR
jgi:protein-S-isoprenylcysteine O-methyltransferase Ste14